MLSIKRQQNDGETVSKKKRYTPLRMLGFVAWIGFILYMSIPALLWYPDTYEQLALHPIPPFEYFYKQLLNHQKEKPEEYFIANGHGDKLHAFFWRKPGADKVVIYHHGNGCNISAYTLPFSALIQMNVNFLYYDYRGFGKSTGKPSVAGTLEDGKAAYEFVHNRLGFSPTKIINYGESFGTAVACHVASLYQCRALILQSGLASMPMAARDCLAFLRPYPDFLMPAPHLDNMALLHNIHVPVTIIHGVKDPLLRFWNAKLLYANANAPKRLIALPGSRHSCVENQSDEQIYVQAVRQAIEEQGAYGS